MIINLKTAKMLSTTVERRPLLGPQGIKQKLTNYDYTDVRCCAGFWTPGCRDYPRALVAGV